jgi:hypothetical protein
MMIGLPREAEATNMAVFKQPARSWLKIIQIDRHGSRTDAHTDKR